MEAQKIGARAPHHQSRHTRSRVTYLVCGICDLVLKVGYERVARADRALRSTQHSGHVVTHVALCTERYSTPTTCTGHAPASAVPPPAEAVTASASASVSAAVSASAFASLGDGCALTEATGWAGSVSASASASAAAVAASASASASAPASAPASASASASAAVVAAAASAASSAAGGPSVARGPPGAKRQPSARSASSSRVLRAYHPAPSCSTRGAQKRSSELAARRSRPAATSALSAARKGALYLPYHSKYGAIVRRMVP